MYTSSLQLHFLCSLNRTVATGTKTESSSGRSKNWGFFMIPSNSVVFKIHGWFKCNHFKCWNLSSSLQRQISQMYIFVSLSYSRAKSYFQQHWSESNIITVFLRLGSLGTLETFLSCEALGWAQLGPDTSSEGLCCAHCGVGQYKSKSGTWSQVGMGLNLLEFHFMP